MEAASVHGDLRDEVYEKMANNQSSLAIKIEGAQYTARCLSCAWEIKKDRRSFPKAGEHCPICGQGRLTPKRLEELYEWACRKYPIHTIKLLFLSLSHRIAPADANKYLEDLAKKEKEKEESKLSNDREQDSIDCRYSSKDIRLLGWASPVDDMEILEFVTLNEISKLWNKYKGEVVNTPSIISKEDAEIIRLYNEEARLYHAAIDGVTVPYGIKDLLLLQKKSIGRMLRKQNMGFFWEPGAGKTLPALICMRYFLLNGGYSFYVCPTNLVGDEIKRVRRIINDAEIFVIQRNFKETIRNGVDLTQYYKVVFILGYEGIQQPNTFNRVVEESVSTAGGKAEICIFDEIHKAKGNGPRREVCKRLAVLSKRRLGLTGTPVINKEYDAAREISLINGGNTTTILDGDGNIQKLHIGTGIVRQMRMYIKLHVTGTVQATKGVGKQNKIEKKIELNANEERQLASLLSANKPIELTKKLIEYKWPLTRMYIKKLIEQNRKLIIFIRYVGTGSKEEDSLKSIHAYLLSLLSNIIDQKRIKTHIGSLNLEERETFMQGNGDILILSESGAIGVDGLQHVCHDIIMLINTWTPAGFDQAVARIARTGQKNTVNIFCPVTSFDPMYKKIMEKTVIKDNVMEGPLSNKQVDCVDGNIDSRSVVKKPSIDCIETFDVGAIPTVPMSNARIVQAKNKAVLQAVSKYKQQPASKRRKMYENNNAAIERHRVYLNYIEKTNRGELRKEFILNWFNKFEHGKTVADLGCGSGWISENIGHLHNVFSIDLVKTKPFIHTGKMWKTNLNECSQDIVLLITSLHWGSDHDRQKTIIHAHSILKPGGYCLVIAIPEDRGNKCIRDMFACFTWTERKYEIPNSKDHVFEYFKS